MPSLPQGVEIRSGVTGEKLRVTFNLSGKRCRETLIMPVSPANIEYAGNLVMSIRNAIERGTFVYAEFFPGSRIVRNQPALASALTSTPQRAKSISASKQKICKISENMLGHALQNLTKSEQSILGLTRFSAIGDHVGIYFLVSHERVVYVGQSTNVHARVTKHFAGKKFDSYTYIPCDLHYLDTLEAAYIEALKPELNVRTPFAGMFKRSFLDGADLGHSGQLKAALIDGSPESKTA